MPKFIMMLAHDVSVYGTVEVEADTLAEAVEKVRDSDQSSNLWERVSEVEFYTSHNYRIISVNDEADKIVAEDIQISEQDEATSLPAEEVLASLTAQRISK